MSALLQKWSRDVEFGSNAPDRFHNGLPFTSSGKLAVQNGGIIDHTVMGLPFTANGRLAVDRNGVVSYTGVGGATFSSAGRLVVAVNE